MKTGLSVVTVMLFCCMVTSLGWGANGDLLDAENDTCLGAGLFTRISDVAIDRVTGDLWGVNQYSGSVCNYSTTPPATLTTTLAHPLGPAGGGAFPTNNFSVGIAIGTAGQLWVLNTGNQAGAVPPYMQQFDQAGVAIGGPVTVALTNASTIPSGLTYDYSNDTLWYRDIGNHELVNIDLLGTLLSTVPVPNHTPGDSQLFGESLCYSQSGPNRYLTITQGDVFDYQVSRVMRVNLTTGEYDGYTVPLDQLYTGFASFIGDADTDTNRISGIDVSGGDLWLSTGRSIYKVDATQPSLFPVSGLKCRAEADGSMTLTWTNHGSGVNNAYANFSIVRNGAVIAVAVPGANTSYQDTSVAIPRLLNSTVSYEVIAIEGMFVASAFCDARTGTGALMDRVPFPGSPSAMAFNTTTDELWVAASSGGASSDIHVYDVALNLQQTITVAGAPLIRGLAYNPDLNWFVYSTGQANFENNLNFIDAATGAAPIGAGTLSIGVPGVTVELGSITYDAIAKDYLVINRHPLDGGTLLRVEAEDNGMVQVPPTAGAFIDSCAAGISLDFAKGVSFLENTTDGGFLATVQAGAQPATQINEYTVQVFGNDYVCTPSGNSIPLQSIGNSIQEVDAVQGLVNVGPIAFVGGAKSQSIFRVLLAPSGTFIRGDANGDNMLPDVADITFLVTYLFAPGGAAPQCFDAADANDDGRIDISDPTFLIWHLFLSGSAPSAPFPAPGTDPTFLDGLPCS